MRNHIILQLFFIFPLLTFSNERLEIYKISIQGNKITKNEIILRELTFKTGDIITKEELEVKIKKSEENLTNLLIFNFSKISANIESSKIYLEIKIVERWYIWPYPILEVSERNFNVWWNEFKESRYSDFSRMNYGIFLVWENFRGRNELLKIKYRRGFKEHYLFNYEIPYFNNKKTIGINTFLQLFRRKKSFYKTKQNELVYFTDNIGYTTKDFELQLDIHYRKNTRHKHNMQLNYLKSNIADSIIILNPNYLRNNDNNGDYFKLSYEYINEQRDYIEYPLNGHYINIKLTKHFPGTSPVEHLELMGKIEKHMKISNRLYIGASFMTKLSSDNYQPYFSQEALGFEYYVRTYEYYVVDGQDFWLNKNALKYKLIDKKNFEIPYIKMPQFKKAHYSLYLTLFSDFGYVKDNQNFKENNLTNTLLSGSGVSIDYVTYYDKLIRIEYGINKLGEKGIFLHFTNPF